MDKYKVKKRDNKEENDLVDKNVAQIREMVDQDTHSIKSIRVKSNLL